MLLFTELRELLTSADPNKPAQNRIQAGIAKR
jgi:hypothetical protein